MQWSDNIVQICSDIGNIIDRGPASQSGLQFQNALGIVLVEPV